MSVRRVTDQSLSAQAATAQAHLVDEHQAGRVKQTLLSHPASAFARNFCALLLRRVKSFFEADVASIVRPRCGCRFFIAAITSSSVKSGCSAIKPSRNSACASSGEVQVARKRSRHCPPTPRNPNQGRIDSLMDKPLRIPRFNPQPFLISSFY
jgi:hypothetical protein